jgi:hypothetical protein
MKKLEDFQKEKVEIKSIYGGLVTAGTRVVTYTQCGDHEHTDHTKQD